MTRESRKFTPCLLMAGARDGWAICQSVGCPDGHMPGGK